MSVMSNVLTARLLEPRLNAFAIAADVRRLRARAATPEMIPVRGLGYSVPNARQKLRDQARARELEQQLRDYADAILAGYTAIESRLVLGFEGGPAWPIIGCPRNATPEQRRAWRLSASGHSREWLEPGLVIGGRGGEIVRGKVTA